MCSFFLIFFCYGFWDGRLLGLISAIYVDVFYLISFCVFLSSRFGVCDVFSLFLGGMVSGMGFVFGMVFGKFCFCFLKE